MSPSKPIVVSQDNIGTLHRVLKHVIGENYYEETATKLNGILSILPNAHFSIVSYNMDLIAISDSQKFLLAEVPKNQHSIKCYTFYKKLGSICRNCKAKEAMDKDEMTFVSGQAALKRRIPTGNINKEIGRAHV